jgi:hypothetical protein
VNMLQSIYEVYSQNLYTNEEGTINGLFTYVS